MTLLQREEPLVHVLHEQLCNFIRTLMKRFINQDIVGEEQGEELLNLDMVNSANELNNLNMDLVSRLSQHWKDSKNHRRTSCTGLCATFTS